MPNLTVETVRSDGVSLVELLLEANGHCRVHLEVTFDGPMWVPGTASHSTVTWDDGTAAVELDAETLPIGFATPVEVGGGAVEIVEVEQLSAALPAGIASWLERVEKRIVVAERLSAVTTLEAAANELASLGGLAAVETLAAEISRDRRLAVALSIVPKNLRERLEAIDIPVSSFAQLAHPRRS